MIKLEDGLELSGRCICGYAVGWISEVTRTTYSIRWMDGHTTTQLRPDLDDEDETSAEAA